METLEEQLLKVNLNKNNSSLSPTVDDPNKGNMLAKNTSSGKVAAFVNSIEEDNRKIITQGALKKVGPLVPPKPHKKKEDLQEVIYSDCATYVCEPHSQSLGGSLRECKVSSVFPSQGPSPLLQKKLPIYTGRNNLYEKTSKVTLDNPAILEQQLEALAHHKKQLEKKGLLQRQVHPHQLQQQDRQEIHSTVSRIPKLSSISLMNDLRVNDLSDKIYTNLVSNFNENVNNSVNVYSNIDKSFSELGKVVLTNAATGDEMKKISSTCGQNIYSNLIYDNETVTKQTTNGLINSTTNNDYLHSSTDQDDEPPPPPSPVSSSYSELRRATDVYPKNSILHNAQNNVSTNNGSFPNYDSASNTADAKKITGNMQTYINLNYNNPYNINYSPTTQSISQDSSDYYGYGSFSQSSSTYESIYEPINPRPPSQLSTRSNYHLYAPENTEPVSLNTPNIDQHSLVRGINNTLYPVPASVCQNSIINKKADDVETLTELLVHSIDTRNDIDNYGVCFKCSERVLGENSGCTAMGQIYHIACFTCSQCQINLQGKPFYALDGKPFCEYDYLQTLEKCSVCMKPILERILRATGKPYHPQCFTCVVCNKSLDGIPFTVDATNQNYCITDFHKKFAPRCCVCKEPIMPEPGEEETVRVVALDRSFHFECYKCEDCDLLLSSEAEGRGCYPLDDHVLCKSCNAKRVQVLTDRMTTEL